MWHYKFTCTRTKRARARVLFFLLFKVSLRESCRLHSASAFNREQSSLKWFSPEPMDLTTNIVSSRKNHLAQPCGNLAGKYSIIMEKSFSTAMWQPSGAKTRKFCHFSNWLSSHKKEPPTSKRADKFEVTTIYFK